MKTDAFKKIEITKAELKQAWLTISNDREKAYVDLMINLAIFLTLSRNNLNTFLLEMEDNLIKIKAALPDLDVGGQSPEQTNILNYIG